MLRTRLRKTAEMAKVLAEHEEGERAAALHAVREVAVARLLSGWLIPSWRLAEFAIWLLGAPIALGLLVWQDGFTKEAWVFSGFVFVAVGLTNRRGLRLILERQRIARQYVDSEKVMAPRVGIMHQMEGGTRREFLFGALGSSGAALLAMGVGGLAHDPETGWPVALLVSGMGILSLPYEFVRSGAVRPISVDSN